MGFGGDLGVGGAAGSNGPNRLVRYDYTGELIGGQRREAAVKLCFQNRFGLSRFPLFQPFPNANNRRKPVLERGGRAFKHRLVGLAEVLAPLAVTDDDVAAADRANHGGADFPGERTFRFPVDVLRRYLNGPARALLQQPRPNTGRAAR